MANFLGVEAARLTIADEFLRVTIPFDIYLDKRHVFMLADSMTFSGSVVGITRFGMARMNRTVLALASFEKSGDQIFTAAKEASTNHVREVGDCILLGEFLPIGTGMLQIFVPLEFI
eukprot:gnl/MRDRNA2_/MRDRNA2_86807_c0_seq1.p2 gnl/MRDRNA2_/MRDRNA2_86807_c0~~gnl/MRDRNA2_/MRDRNA2_86807_c0_seq1.p2  ORF type:complete len:117 (+),score=8.43 gnl/MRDRNA2_/MRDRNA2_86807_c0_seq1:588-938(+)